MVSVAVFICAWGEEDSACVRTYTLCNDTTGYVQIADCEFKLSLMHSY